MYLYILMNTATRQSNSSLAALDYCTVTITVTGDLSMSDGFVNNLVICPGVHGLTPSETGSSLA